MVEEPGRGRRTLKNPRRSIALLAILAMTITVISAPAPAFAATPKASVTGMGSGHGPAAVTPNVPRPGSICLTNSNTHCLGIDPGTAVVIVAGINAAVEILKIFIGKDNDNDDEDEIEDEANGLCLTDTGLHDGVVAHWGTCGANGTVWILVPHTDGAYMYSRYSVDRGTPRVLTADPLSFGASFYVHLAGAPGSPWWQTFTQY